MRPVSCVDSWVVVELAFLERCEVPVRADDAAAMLANLTEHESLTRVGVATESKVAERRSA